MTNASDFSLENELEDTAGWDDTDALDAGYDDEDPEEQTLGAIELAERHALRRVANLRTELEDITEVEYRQLRLEKVVLVGVWTSGTTQDAENSLAELAL
ncbi:MAG: GTPase HflX, partial [Nocardioides sp.]